MDIKILKIAGVLALLILLYACPKEDCGFVTKNAFVPDLMTISPFQGTYHVGDEIICSITINSANDYFYGGNVDIFDETNINNVNICDCELHKLFENNQFTIIEGDYSNFKPVMKYFPNENEYRFKALIKFTKIATYSVFAKVQIRFKKEGDFCISYIIDTNIEGMSNYLINFNVIQP